MDSYSKTQRDISSKIAKARTNYKKSPKERITLAYVETRLETLEQQWTLFMETHRSIITEVDWKDIELSTYHKSDTYEETEELYTDYKSELKDVLHKLKIDSSKSNDTLVAQDTYCGVKFSDIALPKFSGKYTEWPTFRDLFVSLIHNEKRLSEVTKLRQLKIHLVGEAEQLLRHIPIAIGNYELCWNKLESRYNNKKYISNCILKRLLGQRNAHTESANAVRELLDTTTECLSALSNLNINTSSWDVIIIYIIASKLDNESRKQWELKACEVSEELPTFKQFQTFLENRFKALEFIEPKVSKQSNNLHSNQNNVKSLHVTSPSQTCTFCSDNHKLGNCKAFSKEDVEARRNFVLTHKLCFNCFGANHNVYSCRQLSRCRICKKKHHSLLHHKDVSKSSVSDENRSDDKVEVLHVTSSLADIEPASVISCFSKSSSQVLLATALVKVESKTGAGVIVRSLLDQGSQASLITESSVQLLGLKKIYCKRFISGLESDESVYRTSKWVVYFKMQSLSDPSFKISVKAHVLSKLTSHLPAQRFVASWSEFANMVLADPSFDTPNKIDLLLGAEVYGQVLLEGLVKGPLGCPIAQKTTLGWIISGQTSLEEYQINTEQFSSNTIVNVHTHFSEDELLKKFWEIESDSLLEMKKQFTPEEQRCEDIFVKTTERDTTGRYVVTLPFRDADPQSKYGHTKAIATKRFHQLEKRLQKDPELKLRYSRVIKEYIELNHAEILSEDQHENQHAVYLPHHAVCREDKTTTKLRVVFDASCTGTNGVSLNNDLMVGPTLQSDLRCIILRWRIHAICLVADIVKMYRQVKVTDKHTDYQRFLWRDDPREERQHLRLLRVTFGTASAPYLAVRALHQVVYDEGKDFPMASERVLRDFYMDDFMTGCQSVSQGKTIFEETTEMLNRAGFQLQKWSSNCEELLNEIGGDQVKTEEILQLKVDTVTKILGLTWNRRTDEFEYTVQLPDLNTPVTKRKVISDISRLFDPLGWIAPIIIKEKILIQKLWIAGIGWDDEVPSLLLNEWIKYRQNLSELTLLKIPRWLNMTDSDVSRELHGFCDASKDAYAAVIYVRTINCNGKVCVSLLTAKTKVAPIKQVSIPRLELCGAVLLAKLLNEMSKILSIEKEHIHAWTDSTVVLAWLSSHPRRWKTFVANRVSEILTTTDRSQWSHVTSGDNPADCASRGTSSLNTPETEIWTQGPNWLKQSIIHYSPQSLETNLEEGTTKLCHVTTHANEDEVWTKFSSLRKLVRVIAFCRRFLNFKNGNDNSVILTPWLNSTEIQQALRICLKRYQSQEFKEELESIQKTEKVNKKSKLNSLNPFIDKEGLLRVGGRLEKAGINAAMKHPIIIPHNSHLTNLIIADAHERTLHGGPQIMINYLRTKYWVVGAKNLVKLFVRKCVICIRHNATTKNQFMGQLPAERGSASRPFHKSGVDFAGPISIRTTKGRGHHAYKGYICLFICMATRAIHLEAVSDMTSQGFLAAFKRFVARRGHCADLWSDNGSNFIGASRELKIADQKERLSLAGEIADALANNGTNWHFIPPHAPNFGGLWEAGIKSTKHHLKRVIGNSTLTFEEMTTVLAQIEACLNSRPISKISDDPSDPLPLTPGHFLVGGPLVLVPDENFENSNINSLRRWQLTQRMVQTFWRRWSTEYLVQFFHRRKWVDKVPEPNVGDVVLIKEDLPPARWLYGLVIEKHPGSDKITRVVSLRCKGMVIKRPISKICVLCSA